MMKYEEVLCTDLPAWIRIKRKEQGLNQTELGARVGFEQRLVCRIESKTIIRPNPDQIVALVHALGYQFVGKGKEPGVLKIKRLTTEERDVLLRRHKRTNSKSE